MQSWLQHNVLSGGVLLAGLLWTRSTAVAQDVDLSPRFLPGHELHYRYTAHISKKVTSPKDERPGPDQAATQEVGLLIEIISQTTQQTTVSLTIESVKMSVTAPMAMQFDSESPVEDDSNNPLAGPLRALVGTVLTLELDGTGAIASVSGGESLLERENPVSQIAAPLVAPESVRRKFGPIFSLGAPASGVAAKGTWTTKSSEQLGPGISIDSSFEHTLDSANDEEAHIITKGSAQLSKGTVENTHFKVTWREALLSGQAIFDRTMSNLRSMKSTQKLKLELEMDGLPATMESEHRITLDRID